MEKIRKFKGLEAPESSQPQDLNKLQMQSGNLYRSLAVIANRSNQISIDLKQELNSKLEEFAVTSEVLEEIVENREQIEISKYYEKLSHPTILALRNSSATSFSTANARKAGESRRTRRAIKFSLV